VSARLSEIQRVLSGAIAQFESLVDHDELGPSVEAITTGNDRLSPRQQADIYREQFWLRHRDVLYDDFPSLAYLLGEDSFEPFCRDYLRAWPPDSYTLRDLGEHLPGFATGYRDFDEPIAALAKDTARFERLFADIFDGPDAAPVDAEQIAQLAPEAWAHATLTLHPLLRLENFNYPVQDLREKSRNHGDIRQAATLPPVEERLVEAKPTRLCMYRGKDLKVHYMPMKESAFALASLLAGGTGLVEACDRVVARIPADERDEFAGELSSWFKQWALRGWIVGVDVSAP